MNEKFRFVGMNDRALSWKIMPYRLFRCLHKIMNNYKPAMKQDVVVLRFVGYIKGDDLSCDKTV